MTPEEIIEGLQNIAIHETERNKWIDAAIDYIEKHRWRKVEEELPEPQREIDWSKWGPALNKWMHTGAHCTADMIQHLIDRGWTHYRYRDDPKGESK